MQTENNDTRKIFLENVFLTVVDKMNYNELIKNTYVFEEEDSRTLDDEFRPFVISANTDFNDKLYFFFVNLSDILPEFVDGENEPIIPVSYMLLSEYGKSPEQFLEDISQKVFDEIMEELKSEGFASEKCRMDNE